MQSPLKGLLRAGEFQIRTPAGYSHAPDPRFIVCSPRPLVGKTLVARQLTEFLLLKNGEVAAFDINLKEPTLLDYLPAVTETADIDDTYGKMALMDRLILNDGVAKVIDLGFHAFDEF